MKHVTATQVEIEATMSYCHDGDIHHKVTTMSHKDGWQDFSVYLRKPTGATWMADCSDHETACHLAKILALIYQIPILDKVELRNEGIRERESNTGTKRSYKKSES